MPADASVRAVATPRRLFYWCHTTSRQPFETGIQRVTRRLSVSLSAQGFDVVPVGRHEGSGLIEVVGQGARAFETLRKGCDQPPTLFIPELTADLVARGADPVCMAKAYGMRTVSFVHDLIPLKLREHYSAAAMSMFVAYYESFARADNVLATTCGVAAELRQFLDDHELYVPPIAVVPLPAQFGDRARTNEAAPVRLRGEPLKLVTVVSWERRKNLLRLLRAVERARDDAGVELTLVGRRGDDLEYNSEVDALLSKASGITVRGTLSDDALFHLITKSHATIYPSWEEGFGLPIGESLWLGRPCICHTASSMQEIAPGGGTLLIDMLDEKAIAETLIALATQPALLERLADEAITRPLPSWLEYGRLVASSTLCPL